MTRTRFFSMPCSFFTEPPTAGLPPLAACLIIRARAESLIGVMTRSSRSLGVAHGKSADEVEEAIAELVRRDLVAWWPDHELFVVIGAAHDARGAARGAADAQVDSLPSFARAAALREPPSGGWSEGSSEGGSTGAPGEGGKGGSEPIAIAIALALADRTRDQGTQDDGEGPRLKLAEPLQDQQPTLTHPVAVTPARKSDRKSKDKISAEVDAAAKFLFAEINAARIHIGRRKIGVAEPNPGMLKSFAYLCSQLGGPPDDEQTSHVVDVRAAMDSRDEGYGTLDWEHLCRPANWQRYRDREVGKWGRVAATRKAAE